MQVVCTKCKTELDGEYRYALCKNCVTDDPALWDWQGISQGMLDGLYQMGNILSGTKGQAFVLRTLNQLRASNGLPPFNFLPTAFDY
jgi:hypothetical protein